VAIHVPQVTEIVRELNAATGKRVSLVGWSMAGVISREVALHQPQWIRREITMGSPITGGPEDTAFANQLASEGVDLDAIAAHIHYRQRMSPPMRVPVTAIFSRRDGVVAWQACIDQVNQSVEHVEVKSSHLGFGFDPALPPLRPLPQSGDQLVTGHEHKCAGLYGTNTDCASGTGKDGGFTYPEAWFPSGDRHRFRTHAGNCKIHRSRCQAIETVRLIPRHIHHAVRQDMPPTQLAESMIHSWNSPR
jgi:hypothetical protein